MLIYIETANRTAEAIPSQKATSRMLSSLIASRHIRNRHARTQKTMNKKWRIAAIEAIDVAAQAMDVIAPIQAKHLDILSMRY
jgi:hypothetical protein